MHATPEKGQLAFDSLQNFGFVRKGEEVLREIAFKNIGKGPIKVEIQGEGLPIQVRLVQNFFTLQSEVEKKIQVGLQCTSLGIFRAQIIVKVDGVQLQKSIDINATCIEYTRFLLDQFGTQSNHLAFSHVFFGEKNVIQTKIFNNTPVATDFKVLIMEGTIKKEN